VRWELAAYAFVAAACLGLYWPGLMVWFSADDFAWLGLRLSIDSAAKFWSALFEPRAQGTVRPLSERIYFLTLERLFGLDALPFRIVAFATHLGNLWMVMRLSQRVTGSLAAGAIAALAWTANSALGQAMSWSSAYNQILWPAFVLGGLHCRWTWLSNGSARARRWEWVFFLLGFGALEMQVTYPLLAGLLTLLYRRERWASVVPMAAVAAAYAAIHRLTAKPQTNPLYVLHWDVGIFSTLSKYARMVFGVWRPGQEANVEAWQFQAEAVVISASVGALAWAAWKRDKWVLFGAGWFLATLLPVLPLRDKVSDYYLSVPSLGLAFAAGALAARYPWAAAAPVALYIVSSAVLARRTVDYNFERAETGRRLVQGVEAAVERNPGKIILLTGVGSDAYWTAVNDDFFRLIPNAGIYLAPGADENIQRSADLGDPSRFVAAPGLALTALAENRAVVYSAAGEKLVNVTELWKTVSAKRWRNVLSPVVDLSKVELESQLGDGWHRLEGYFRWSSERAALRLGPVSSRAEFFVRAYRPPEGDSRPEVKLRASLNGVFAGEWRLTTAGEEINTAVPVPAAVDPSKPIDVELAVDPPIAEIGGGRRLGLVFGTVGIRYLPH